MAAGGNITRAAAHIVVGTSVPSINISNAGLENVPVPEKCSFVKATAAGRGAVCLADDDLTSVASINSASAGTKNGDSGFDLGGTPALPFWKSRARALLVTVFVHVDGNTWTTRVAITHVVVGTRVPSIKVAHARACGTKDNGRDDGLGGIQRALACWKMHVRTLITMLVLPVQLLIRALVHLPLLVKVGILGFPVFAFFVLVIPGLTMHLCGYRVLGLGQNKQCRFPKFYVSLLVSLFGGVGVVQAAFAPADRAALKAAVGTCLSETADGSCPIFAASDATPGNPYGVIGSWDVSAVTSMEQSKCTRVLPLCWPRRLPLWCVVEYIRHLEVRRVTSLTRVVLVFGVV